MNVGKREAGLAEQYDHLLELLSDICSRIGRDRLFKTKDALDSNRKLLSETNRDLRRALTLIRKDTRQFRRLINSGTFEEELHRIDRFASQGSRQSKFLASYRKLFQEFLQDADPHIRSLSRLLKTQDVQLGHELDDGRFKTAVLIETQIKEHLRDIQRLTEGRYRNSFVELAHEEASTYQNIPDKAERFITNINAFEQDPVSFWVLVKVTAVLSVYLHSLSNLHNSVAAIHEDVEKLTEEFKNKLAEQDSAEAIAGVTAVLLRSQLERFEYSKVRDFIISKVNSPVQERIEELIREKRLIGDEIHGFGKIRRLPNPPPSPDSNEQVNISLPTVGLAHTKYTATIYGSILCEKRTGKILKVLNAEVVLFGPSR